MKKKSYDVTKEMVEKLEDGLAFSNFTELSRYLGALDKKGKALGGNSKIQFLAELERYVELKKDGTSYTIVRVRPEDEILPPRSTGGNIRYSLMLQNMLAYHILHENKYSSCIELFWNPVDMLRSCGLVNERFYKWSEFYCPEDKRDDAIAFRYNTKEAMEGYLETALNAMARNKELICEDRKIVFVNDKPPVVGVFTDECGETRKIYGEPEKPHIPSKDDYATYLRMVTETVKEFETKDGRMCTSEQDVFLSGHSKAYYKKLNSLIKKYLGYDRAVPMYHIITEPTSLRRAMKRIERIVAKEEVGKINQTMCERIPKLKSVRRGKAVLEPNPEHKEGDNKKSSTYVYHRLSDEDMNLFVNNMIRISNSMDVPIPDIKCTPCENPLEKAE